MNLEEVFSDVGKICIALLIFVGGSTILLGWLGVFDELILEVLVEFIAFIAGLGILSVIFSYICEKIGW